MRMECNKDEAIRAKGISERKMTEKDMAGARKFAMKAQNLYPGLDGLPQLLATIDVYVASERKVNGEVDWYGVLGVDPSADDDTIRKHYRKLALVLHPDKNKLEVADGAFKILSEAWSLLSDKAKRTAYDLKRNPRGANLKVPSGSRPAPATGNNGGHSFTSSNNTARNRSAPQTGNNGGRGFTSSNNTTRNQSASRTSNNGAHNFTSNNTTRNQSAPPTGNNGGHNFTRSNNTNRNRSAPVSNSGAHNFTSSDNTMMNQSAPAGNNGVHRAKDDKRTTNPKPARPPPSSSKPNTFWTLCSLCRMQYEYLRTYLNHTLLCPNCHEPFLAFETPPPPAYTHGSYTPWTAYQQKQSSNQQTGLHTTKENTVSSGKDPASTPNAEPACSSGVASFNRANNAANNASGSYSKSDSVRTTASASSCAQSTHGFQPTYEKLEREHKEAKTTAMKEPTLPRKTTVSKKSGGLATGASNIGSSSVFKGESPVKRRRINEFSPNDSRSQGTNQMRMENGGAGIGNLPGFQNCNSEMGRINASRSTRLDIRREPSQLEIRNMLMEKARRELVKKLSEWSSAAESKASVQEEQEKEKEKEKPKATVSGRKSNASKPSESADTINRIRPKTLSATLPTDADENETEPMTMSVPDPDIHDFDKDRTELSFGENQVWAAYDDDDGMPRYYAMIHSVISLKPFKLRISWLNAKSNTELAPLNWVVSGFSKTSGEFRIGKQMDNDSLNSFSHKVKWTKGVRGRIQIYPRKGDVWALYRNWSPDWDELTPDEVIHKYEMVEVIKDYNEDQGVVVVPLVKVSGFKTVFHQHLDPNKVRMIPREELFRFSHQVPSYLLTGQEAENAPKGCLELDPAATPVELLQVITDFKEEETAVASEKGNEEVEET